MEKFKEDARNEIKDSLIRKKFQEDNYIPERINNIFEDFKNPNENIFGFESVKNQENSTIAQRNNDSTINKNDEINEVKISNQKAKSANNKVFDIFSYKNINKILSMAAVFLCVVLVRNGNISKE